MGLMIDVVTTILFQHVSLDASMIRRLKSACFVKQHVFT